MKRIALALSAAPILGACTDNGQSYYLESLHLEKDYVACKSRDLIKLIARNYGKPKEFDELVRMGLEDKNCRVFRAGEKVMVSINKQFGRIETINDHASGEHYATFDPVD
ncbi:hypothetical protein [Microvirga vignae]|uniref:hypothetical protein n=1 Tax=Microvirga vignae TaxID=1225564 RepID=UPI0012378C06|nr:hypothetical protein [Microvirga vignae]